VDILWRIVWSYKDSKAGLGNYKSFGKDIDI